MATTFHQAPGAIAAMRQPVAIRAASRPAAGQRSVPGRLAARCPSPGGSRSRAKQQSPGKNLLRAFSREQEASSSMSSADEEEDGDAKPASAAPPAAAAAEEEEEEAQGAPEKEKAKSTISSLNMLLGIDEEAERKAKEEKDARELGLDDFAQKKAAKEQASAELAKKVELSDPAAARTPKQSNLEGEVSEQMEKLMEQAKKLREEQKENGGVAQPQDEQQLRKEFENLLTMLKPDGGVSKDDIKALKDQVFGPMSFWVTETRQTDELDGYLIRGNLRAPREEVFPEVIAKVQQLFDGKYEILIVEDPDVSEPYAEGELLRPAFKLVPASAAYPPSQSSWQVLVSLVLLSLTAGSCMQLGLVAEISKLPPETLQWLLNPDNLQQADAVPPGLDNFDAVSYVASAVPIALMTLGLQGIHEIGHVGSAFANGVKLGPSFIFPNGQIGTFGSITQIKSMLRDNRELFDVAVAGPLAGGAASLAVFMVGLLMTTSAQDAGSTADLIPIPTQLLQSSLGLSGLTSLFLGEAVEGQQVLVHPAMIAGWAGLYTTALNLLPVGCLDGGRIVQSAFGRSALTGTSFITYLGLALGFLGGELALPFGLYVLLVQRTTEQYIQDSVTEVSESRKSLASVLVFLSFFILLPNIPDIADSAASGVNPDYFF